MRDALNAAFNSSLLSYQSYKANKCQKDPNINELSQFKMWGFQLELVSRFTCIKGIYLLNQCRAIFYFFGLYSSHCHNCGVYAML